MAQCASPSKDERYVECGRKVEFSCQHCGRCCTDFFVPVGAGDLKALHGLGGNVGSLSGKIVMVDAMNPLTGKEVTTPSLVHPCPFYNHDERSCIIYPSRPKTCAIFPFFVKKEHGEHYFHSGACPGVGKGPKVDLHEMLPLVKALDRDIAALKAVAKK